MEDYRSTKQTVDESPKQQSVDESQPEQSVGDKQSVVEASQYENRRERLIATNRYDSYVKAGTECKRKSRLLVKGGIELLQECKREESKQRQLRRKKRKKEDDAWKRMEQQEMQL